MIEVIENTSVDEMSAEGRFVLTCKSCGLHCSSGTSMYDAATSALNVGWRKVKRGSADQIWCDQCVKKSTTFTVKPIASTPLSVPR